MPWDLFWTTLDTWLPNLMAFIKFLPTAFDALVNFEYKKFLVNCSYIYYYTIFFLTLRILIYCGITLINLINIKHTTNYKKLNSRVLATSMLKFYNVSSLKKALLAIVTLKYL